MRKVKILGIPFDNVTKQEASDIAFNYVAAGKQAVVVTPNAEILQLCFENEAFKSILIGSEIILPDGEGVLWAAKKLGTPLLEKVAGVEFGEDIIQRAAKSGKTLFILGGKPGVAEKAAEKLSKRFPTLRIAGTANGYFARDGKENMHVIDKINKSGADILFVCLGAPAQELWVHKNRGSLSPLLIACLGGSIDIYAENGRRAPKIFIKLHAEWLYRLLCEPRRIGRMMRLPKFMKSVKKYIKIQNEV